MKANPREPETKGHAWNYRELHNISTKFKAAQPQDGGPQRRSFFFKQKRPSRPEDNTYGMRAFTQGFRTALDRYRVSSFPVHLSEFGAFGDCTMPIPYGVIYQETALPMYAVSTIEAALHPLGIVSHSSCNFESFLDAILNFEQVMEYRIGTVRAIQSSASMRPFAVFFLFQFVNGRGFVNWLRLDVFKPLS